MLGAIIGDIAGSRFEWNNYRKKDFEFFHQDCFVTDDSIMSLSIAKAILESNDNYYDLSNKTVYWMRNIGQKYHDAGYGGRFFYWMFGNDPKPYNSFGNGSAMRCSACGFAADSLEEAIDLSNKVTMVTHNHKEGMKGAEATVVCIYLARTGSSIEEIRKYVNDHYYTLDFTLDEIRDTYKFNEICQNTVPEAIEAFLESTGFEDAIRNAISIGGDSDTIGAITGGIAEAYYGIPKNIREKAMTFLDQRLTKILIEFENKYKPKVI